MKRVDHKRPLRDAPKECRLVFSDALGEWASLASYMKTARGWKSARTGLPAPSSLAIVGWLPADP